MVYIALDFLWSPHFFEGVVFYKEYLKGDDLRIRHLAIQAFVQLSHRFRKITVDPKDFSLPVEESVRLNTCFHVDAVCTRHVHFAWLLC